MTARYILGYLLELSIKIWQSGILFLEIWQILAIFSRLKFGEISPK
jgi:hypothetical protein